jgi:hypothetical protein
MNWGLRSASKCKVEHVAWNYAMLSCLPEVLERLRHGKWPVSLLQAAILPRAAPREQDNIKMLLKELGC